MRTLGALMISLSVILTGWLTVKRQKLRIRQLSQCAELIRTIAVEIGYGCFPVYDILRAAAQNEAFSALPFLQRVNEETGCDFSDSWKRSIDNASTLALKREEKDILIRFGKSLGTTDSQTQLILCKRYSSQLNSRLEEAVAHRAEYIRLTCGGSVLLALILFALIL